MNRDFSRLFRETSSFGRRQLLQRFKSSQIENKSIWSD